VAVGSDVEKILANLDLVDLVGEYIRLVKAGKTFKGVCPFHPDTKPSLVVSPERQLWYCFGCHEGGTAFQFLMKAEGLAFPEALRELALRAGVTLGGSASGQGSDREEMLRLNESAAHFYRDCLKGKQGEAFRRYVQERSISPDSVERFELGCTPPSDSGLFEYLVRSGTKAEALLRAGLCLKSEVDGGFSDRFRGRLIFPIRDSSARLVGFGGRAIDGREPKYLNSPETPVFSKGSLLYGLHLAKGSISKSGRAILVEGYTDVIACFQAGVENVVATLGTALGEKHVNIAKRYAATVVAAYDSDSSGLQAMVRSADLFDRANVTLRVARFPQGQDPDEMLRRQGRDAFVAAIEAAIPATDFRLAIALADYDSASPEARRQTAPQIVDILSAIRSPLERAHYISRCATMMSGGSPEKERILEDALRAQVGHVKARSEDKTLERHTAMASAMEPLPRGLLEAEKAVLRAMLERPELAQELSAVLTPGDFNHPDHLKIAERFLSTSTPPSSKDLDWLEEDSLVSPVAQILLDGDGIHAVADREIIDSYVKTIVDFGKQRRWKRIQEETVKCLNEGKAPLDPGLLDEYKELTRYLVGTSTRQAERPR